VKITEAKFVRKYNVGQYENEEYSLTAEVEDGENAVKVLQKLKADVAKAYGASPSKSEEDEEETTPAPKKKSKPAPEPEEEDEEEVDEEETDSDDDDEEESDEEESDEEEEESKPAKKASAKKSFKKKPQDYNRSEQHKEILSSVLKEVAPDWKKSEASKKKAKAVSTKVVGLAFLDEDGEVLKSFKAAVKKMMAK